MKVHLGNASCSCYAVSTCILHEQHGRGPIMVSLCSKKLYHWKPKVVFRVAKCLPFKLSSVQCQLSENCGKTIIIVHTDL